MKKKLPKSRKKDTIEKAKKKKGKTVEVKGAIKSIIYRNEVNSYTIAAFETEEEETTIVGYLPFINEGDTIKAIGNFVEHQEYGRQFKVTTFEKTMPETLEALEKYLANGKIKGLGPATAKKIIDTFGEETLHIFKVEPERLAQIKGITKEKAMEMAQSFIENWEVWQIVGYLDQYGIGPQSAETIYKKLGVNTIEQIEANPYLLIDLTNRADFRQIDTIAMKRGMELENEKRVRSGIKYALKLATNNGHSAVLYENLIQFVKELLGVSENAIEDSLINMKVQKEIVIEDREKQEWVYLFSFYQVEKNVAEKLISLKQYRNVKEVFSFSKKLKRLEKELEIELSEKQKEAVEAINDNNVCIVTGGPGTGKTTIIKTIIDLYKQEGKKVVLCAPTGRAAKRMTEATGEEAKTLHRLLEIGKMAADEMQSEVEVEVSPIDADVIVVDEMSMVDIFLFHYLLQGIYKGTKLVLVGDIDQLPSVGPGNVLKDLIASETITTITLNQIFRQAAKSKIILNSHKVNEGINFLREKEENEEELLKDFFFIAENNQEKVVETILSLSSGRLKNYGNYDFSKNIQIITPTKKGMLGTKELNKKLQKTINPPSEEKGERKYLDVIFREGDRIMQIKNNYDIYWEKKEPTLEMGKGVFNGEYGTILTIDENEKQVKIGFDDEKFVWYSFDELEQIEHAYSITVHKAQRK